MAHDLAGLLGEAAVRAARYRDAAGDAPVFPDASALEELRSKLGPLRAEAASPHAVIGELADAVEPALVASAGPRYFGFVTGGATDAATAADVLAAGWDQNAFNTLTSPAAAVVEEVAGEWLKDVLGLPAGASFAFTTGGQAANTVCLAAARHQVLADAGWDVESDGLAGAPPIRVVAGAERHVTIDRALRLLGLGTAATEPVPAGPGGGISGPALARALAAGPPGPTIVCLQAGEVNTGGFDDFPAAVAAARERGAWVHVDGAFGLWAAASPRTRHLTAGAEAADSWATDGHKWLNVPYDCGYAFCARPRAHQAAMAFTAAYLGDAPETLRSPADWGLESSRRARALATWAALRELGRDGIAALVERCCAHARRFARLLSAAEGVRVVNDVALNQVLVRFGDNDDATERVVAAVQRSGVCWMGSTTWRGMRLMRISVSSWRTTTADVDRSAEAILAAAAGCGLPPGLGQLTDDCRGGAPQDVTRQTGGLGVCLVREIPLMHTQSGAASFSACQQLFRDHQLAVTPPAADSGYPAMVLRHRTAGFFVLTRLEESLFLLRSWRDRSPPGSWHDDDHAGEDVSHDDVAVEIRPGKPVPDLVRQVIVGCLPVPRHGALLGWVTGHQVTALLTVRSKPPVGGARGSPPEIRVLPQAGTSPKQDWPPFCADPLGEWGLWEYIGWHELVDVLPLVTRAAGRAFWVPSPDGRRTGNLVLAGHIRTDEFWLPAGVYADQWALREGIDPPSAGRLAASPGAVDLARAGFC